MIYINLLLIPVNAYFLGRNISKLSNYANALALCIGLGSVAVKVYYGCA